MGNGGPVGAERRRYQRYTIQLSARIEAEGRPAVDCEVIDYCTGGMLIQVHGAENVESQFGVGVAVKLSTHLQTLAQPRPITIPSTVAWASGSQLGIAFVRPSNTLAEILSKTKQLQDRAEANPKPKRARNGVASLELLRRVAEARLPKILRIFLDEALSALLDAADSPASDAERNQLFTDLQGIEQLRSGKQLLEQIMINAFDPASRSSDDELNVDGELRLIDTDEFERWLEGARATTRLERRFSDRLNAIGTRLMSQANSEGLASPVVPFEPKNFADALKTVAEQAQFGVMTRLVLFDRYVKTLSQHLGEFYQALDQSLDEAGLPKAASSPRSPASRRLNSASPVNLEGNQAAPDVSGEVDGLGASQEESESAASVAAGNVVAVDPATLERLLEHDREIRQQQAREWFSNVAETGSGKQGVSEWLGQVDSSLLDEAAGDPDFFRSAKHPLHSIVDALEHLQLLRGTPNSPEAELLNQKVSEILAPLTEADASSDALSAVAQEVSTLSREHSEQYRRNVERVVEASEGRDRVRQAREAVRAELDQRYNGASVPEVVADLVDVGW